MDEHCNSDDVKAAQYEMEVREEGPFLQSLSRCSSTLGFPSEPCRGKTHKATGGASMQGELALTVSRLGSARGRQKAERHELEAGLVWAASHLSNIPFIE